ncbi:predicted protein [Botrytis cinerea T4]|uniref:Uncharacterized protein n=1 Tax=Botryotinia fuckeliana (strain T4) TaxID=999810 RepID=G2XPV5_BOTF4|nr:predicted protein [Botrytis cinerea T4]
MSPGSQDKSIKIDCNYRPDMNLPHFQHAQENYTTQSQPIFYKSWPSFNEKVAHFSLRINSLLHLFSYY